MIERAIVGDFSGFADHDSHPVVDENPAPHRRPGMDLDSRQPARPVREPSGEPAQAEPPQPMGHPAVPDERMQPGIARQHLPPGAGGRVPVEYDGDIFAKAAEHTGIFPFPTGMLNYWGEPSAINVRAAPGRRLPRFRELTNIGRPKAQGTNTMADTAVVPTCAPPGGTMSHRAGLFVPLIAAAAIALPAAAQESSRSRSTISGRRRRCRHRRC